MTWKQIASQFKWLCGILNGFKPAVLGIALIGTASALLGVYFAWVMKNFIDIATGASEGSFIEAALLCAAVLAAQIAVNSLERLVSVKARTKHANKVRVSLFQKLMITDWQTFCSKHSGDYNNRMLSDVDIVSDFLITSIPSMAATLFQLAAASAVLISLEPYLALLAFLITPIFIVLGRIFAKPTREANLNLQQVKGENLSYTQDILQNMAVLRAFERQPESVRKYSDQNHNLLHWNMRKAKLSVLSNAVLSVSWSATYLLSLVWGALRLSQGFISFGTMSAYLQLVGQIQGPLRTLAYQIPGILAASASAERLMEILELPEERNSKPLDAINCTKAGFRLENVRFEYTADDTVLYNVDLEVKPGSMTALIGPTGEGKSTIARLLLALITPLSGKVLLILPNGRKEEVSASTRRAFTYVPQGNTILSGTVADNLRLAKPDATVEQMTAALKTACAGDFVEQLPQGLDTVIGERGTGLSEGQAQRIAIARALLRDAPILILDECTSALDPLTEERVLKNIRKDLNGRACLLITHRKTAVCYCDRVYKLDGGCIVSTELVTEDTGVYIRSAN
jgi:ABC-type multidrug transport system fused ATPase/permease subunit